MSHRVIAGLAKGKRLKLVPGDSTRPITDRAKEALFSILGFDIAEAYIVDLFGGTGAVGIEALSRGAEYVLFTELDRMAIQTIRDNLKHTNFTEKADVRQLDAFALLKAKPDRPYDFIYVAPPQYKGIWKDVLNALDANPLWIEEGVTVIVQIDPSEDEPVELTHLSEYDRRKYGKTLLIFYEGTYQNPEHQE